MAEVDYPRPNIDALKKQSSAKPTALHIGIIIVALLLLGAIFFPVTGERPISSKVLCLSNTKQVVLGCLMYASDEDEHLPLARNWIDSLQPYTKSERIFREPKPKFDDQYAFAYRHKASGLNQKLVLQPQEFALIFDTVLNQRNMSGELSLLPKPGRHNGFDCIGFLDGHAKAFKVDEGGDIRLPINSAGQSVKIGIQ